MNTDEILYGYNKWRLVSYTILQEAYFRNLIFLFLPCVFLTSSLTRGLSLSMSSLLQWKQTQRSTLRILVRNAMWKTGLVSSMWAKWPGHSDSVPAQVWQLEELVIIVLALSSLSIILTVQSSRRRPASGPWALRSWASHSRRPRRTRSLPQTFVSERQHGQSVSWVKLAADIWQYKHSSDYSTLHYLLSITKYSMDLRRFVTKFTGNSPPNFVA